MVGVRVIQAIQVPTSVGWEVRDGVASVGDQFPQVFRRLDAARIAAAHPDDGDGLLLASLHFEQALPGLVQFRGDPAQVLDEPVLVRQLTSAP